MMQSFNPYRVFSSAETQDERKGIVDNALVSIPIGFSHQLRRGLAWAPWAIWFVSIPIGFSHQLRPDRRPDRRGPIQRFNPYRVFSSAETGG